MRNLAVVFTFLLAACGRSETGRENVDNPEGLSDRKRGLGALIRGSSSFAAVSADESRAAEIGRAVRDEDGLGVAADLSERYLGAA